MTTTFRLLALSIAALGLSSCQSTKPAADPYASNPAGGGYNPYPDQGGYSSNAAPTYQQPAATPPASAPQYDPYAYTAPKTTTPKSSASKTTASAKKKTSTVATGTKKKVPSSPSSRHTVKQGETLYGIAHTSHTTVAKLKAANGITSDIIRPGQVLKIP